MPVSEAAPAPGAGVAGPRFLSLDAWVMARPARGFRFIAARPRGAGAWMAARRPLFVALVLGCVVSILTAGSVTLRIVGPATIYWAFVPFVETLVLAAIVLGRPRRMSFSAVVDTFFTGHATWTLFLIAAATALLVTPARLIWSLLTTWALVAMVVVIVWSAYVDFCFFRHLLDRSRASSWRSVLLHRLLTWTVVFAIFAIPGMTPTRLARELVEALGEVFR